MGEGRPVGLTKNTKGTWEPQGIAGILSWYVRNRNRYGQGPLLPAHRPEWHDVVDAYHSNNGAMDAMDLEDLVAETIRVLEEDPRRDTWLRFSCENLLVDDAQEMTSQQYRLFRLMSGMAKTTTITGDLDQTLGVFRGADYGVSELFALNYRDKIVCDLDYDYRSTPEISAIGRALREFAPSLAP